MFSESYDSGWSAPKLGTSAETNSTATIRPTDDADPRAAGTETRPLDIEPKLRRSTDREIRPLADAIVRCQTWQERRRQSRKQKAAA